MNPGLNLNQRDMPQRPCMCSAWNTCVALRFPAANGVKRYLGNSPGLTSHRNRPIRKGPAFPHSGPNGNISSRSFMKVSSASGEVNFSVGLSWPARFPRQLIITPLGLPSHKLTSPRVEPPQAHPLRHLSSTPSSGGPSADNLSSSSSSSGFQFNPPFRCLASSRLAPQTQLSLFSSWWWKASANWSVSLQSLRACWGRRGWDELGESHWYLWASLVAQR